MTEIAALLQRFWELRRLMLVAVLIGLVVGVLSVFKPTSEAPFLKSRSFARGTATTQLLVDSKRSALTNVTYDIKALAARAQVFVQFVDAQDVTVLIAQKAGIDPTDLAVIPYAQRAGSVPARNPTPGQRSDEVAEEVFGHRLEVLAQEDLPVLVFSAQAPTVVGAERLANAGAEATAEYLNKLAPRSAKQLPAAATDLAKSEKAAAALVDLGQVRFEQLGQAQGEEVSYGGGFLRGIVLGLLAFAVSSGLIIFLSGLFGEMRARRVRSGRAARSTTPAP
jgi:hypothetical protein